MKKFILPFLLICTALNAQLVIPANVQRLTDGTNELLTPINAGTGKSIGIHTGGTFRFDSGGVFAGSASAFRMAIGAGTSSFDGAWSSLTGTPTTLAGYGITDPIVLTSGSYANPAWITSIAWSKISSTPTTLAGYGITDPVVTTAGSYANPSWITSLADSKLTGAYTASGQTMATSRILGRTTASSGAAEELTASAVIDLVGSTRGSVLYRGASGWSILTPGTSGYVLQSGGAGADPSYVAPSGGGTWGSITGTLSDQTDLQSALDGKQPLAAKLTSLAAMTWGANSLIYSPTSSTVGVVTTGNSGVLVTSSGGVPSIATDIPTAVTIGGGAIYRAGGTDVAVADGGTGIGSGTSGGILGFTGSGTIASSVALPANAIVLGGGAGATPTPLGSLGTTTTLLHGNASGAPTFSAVSLTADVSGILPSANGGLNNAFFGITGPASTLKTFTFPNADSTVLTDNAAVTVAQGGSGRATGTTAYALIATGTTATGAQQTLPNGATTELLVGGGASALPVWTTATGSGAPVRATSPTLVTPTLGVATATSINGNTLTTGTYTLTGSAGKTLTFTNNLTLSGTDGVVMTTPTTSFTAARTDAANTFTGVQGMTSPAITTSLTTPSTTFALVNTTATTVNFAGGASTALNIGNASGTTSMLGIIGFDGATASSSTAAIFPAATTSLSSIRLPHGSAPTSPVNGDVWTTTTGLNVRINGATQLLQSTTAPGSDTYVLFNDGGAFGADSGMSYNKTTDSLTLAGTLSSGSGSSVAGGLVLTQGTANSTGTTAIIIQAPTSVTSYNRTLEGSAGSTGVYIGTTSGTTVTDSRVAPGTSGNVLTSNGTTWVSSAAAGGTGANPSATIGLSAVNGSATTYLRSDGAPALSQAIAPTWTGVHTFTPALRTTGSVSYFTLTTPADTTLTASTEAIGANFTAATRQFSTGAITTQRERVFGAPTYGFVGASTITTAVNADFTAPIAGTNATLTNRWAMRADRAQVTSLFDASSATSQIGPLVDSVDGTTPLNNIIQTVASGTAYTLTATSAAVDFGTTDPIITIPNAGTYWVSMDIQYNYVGATFAANRQFDEKIRRTNNTAADVTGSAFSEFIPTLTTITDAGPHAHIGPFLYTTAGTTDTLQAFADVSVLPTAGSVTVTACVITAIRAY